MEKGEVGNIEVGLVTEATWRIIESRAFIVEMLENVNWIALEEIMEQERVRTFEVEGEQEAETGSLNSEGNSILNMSFIRIGVGGTIVI